MERLRTGDPEQIGPWQIVNRLGSGGMGVVFMGTNGTRAAAIKVLRDYLLDDPTSRTRLAREVEALERVRGNYAAEIVGSDTESNPAWIATNYVDGPSLKTLVDREGPLNENQWLEFAFGLMDALASIHALGVIHRDIKPSNILIAKDGPKLIDFGISLSGDATSLTGTGLVAGTPSWLAPEQFLGRPLSTALDNFAAGSTLVFAATGGNPWDKDDSSVAAVMHSIINNKLDVKKLNPLQKSICEKLLIKDPEQRAAAAEIRDFIKNQSKANEQAERERIESQLLAEKKRTEDELKRERQILAEASKAEEKRLANEAKKLKAQEEKLQKEQQKLDLRRQKELKKAKPKKAESLSNFKELAHLTEKTKRRRFLGSSKQKRTTALLSIAISAAVVGVFIMQSQNPETDIASIGGQSVDTGSNETELPKNYLWEGLIEGETEPQSGKGKNFQVFVCDQSVRSNTLALELINGFNVSNDINVKLLRGDSRCGAEFDTIEVSGSSNELVGTSVYVISGQTATGFNFEYGLNLKIEMEAKS